MKKSIRSFLAPVVKKMIRPFAGIIYEEAERVRDRVLLEQQRRTLAELQSCGEGVILSGHFHISDPKSVVIGNNVYVGDNAFFSSAGGLTIGDDTHISNNVTIHTVDYQHSGSNLPDRLKKMPKPVSIGHNVWIGMNVTIIPGVRVGDGARIEMGTVVTRDVPPMSAIESGPSRVLKHHSNHTYMGFKRQRKKEEADRSILEVNEFANLHRKLNDPSILTFFVVTSGRSGSKTIADLLSQHPRIVCLHEPRPQLIRLSSELAYALKDKECVKTEIAHIYCNSVAPRASIYGESDQKLFNLITIMAEILPKSKYVWLIRDGRDVVASMFGRGWFSDDEIRGGNPVGSTLERYQFYRLNGAECGAFSNRQWEELPVFERNCWYWQYVNTVIERDLTVLSGDRWTFLRLEELEASLDRLIGFLGLEPFQFELAHSNKATYPVRRWRAWSQSEKETFDRVCGGGMDQWYPTWRDE